jgi:hypothetical protein
MGVIMSDENGKGRLDYGTNYACLRHGLVFSLFLLGHQGIDQCRCMQYSITYDRHLMVEMMHSRMIASPADVAAMEADIKLTNHQPKFPKM